MFRLVLRIVMLLSALQVSGLGALIVSDCCSTDDDDCATQSEQKPCNDCPPDCPKCNCNHVVFSVPRAPETSRVVVIAKKTNATWTPYEINVPRAPWLSSVFRPPRAPLST